MMQRGKPTWRGVSSGVGNAIVAAWPFFAVADLSSADLQARVLSEAPVLDGAVVDDPAWAATVPATEFWQTTPDEGKAASERTEVRVAYTPETLFVGVVCFDREPDKIVVSDSRRDAPLDETDSFQIILDTFNDRHNGFVFGTNPAGIEYDGQVTNEGEGSGPGSGPIPGRQQGGSGAGFNLNWDASWAVKTKRGDFGWSAEFAIPFRTLRYASGGAQQWGVNFQRNIRRRKETAFWSPLSRQFNLYRLSRAGALTGLDLKSQRNLKIAPFALAKSARDYAASGPRRTDADVGGDLKYSLTPSLTLDATVNTDFAQVEVDDEQINLDRFNLFFPEKRPFFLENGGQFAVGSPGEVDFFFSRRIGIAPEGEVVPILAGGRLTGKVGSTNVGLIEMQTRDLLGVSPANNFAVARVSQELPNRSNVGLLFVNREATGRSSRSGDHNRTFGFDGRLGFGKYTQVSGWAGRTDTPGRAGSEGAYHVSLVRDSPAWLLQGKFTRVGEDFNPEVGFLSRDGGFRKPEGLIFRTIRPKSFLGIHEMRPHVSYRGYWDADSSFHQTGFLHCDTHWEWKSGWELHTAVNFTHEGVAEPFEIFPGVDVPRGGYEHKEAQFVLKSNQGKPLSFDGTFVFGGFYGGHRNSWRPSAKARVGDAFGVDVQYERNDVSLPVGAFVANLLRTRISYSFTPRLFVQALLQYNNFDDRWSTNLRFGWLQTANTGLFVVYNETRDTIESPWPVRDRRLTVKFSRLFDLLN